MRQLLAVDARNADGLSHPILCSNSDVADGYGSILAVRKLCRQYVIRIGI